MSNYKTLHKELTKILAPIADRKGEVMYSPAEALRPNDVYLLGFNPGQGGPETSIQEHLTYSLKRTDNAWLDERWGKIPGESSPLQDRMWKLFEALGLDLRTTPASNLIFRTSPDMTGVDYHILSELCWPAHELILSIVKPSKIIAFGNGEDKSPYAFIRDRYECVENPPQKFYGSFSFKRLSTIIDGRLTAVLGIPHPSRCKPKSETYEWLKR